MPPVASLEHALDAVAVGLGGPHLLAIQSAYGIAGTRTVLYVEELSNISINDLDGAVAIYYVKKGFSDHVEVICRIKGIPTIRAGELRFTQGNQIRWPKFLSATPEEVEHLRTFPGQFQAVVFDHTDLADLDYTSIDTVFVRFEHLLYRAIARIGERPDSLDSLHDPVREELDALTAALPPNITLLVRGLDVRSDDRMLSGYFFSKREANPELGKHGTRYLLDRPEIVEFMADAMRCLPGRPRFACPFITTHREFVDFTDRYSDLFDNPSLIPFVESPAAFEEIGLYQTDKLCIGLKDLTQFYFAADRANSSLSSNISYLDHNLMSALTRMIRAADQNGTQVHLYQQTDTLREYARALTGTRWIPSMAASDLKIGHTATKSVEY